MIWPLDIITNFCRNYLSCLITSLYFGHYSYIATVAFCRAEQHFWGEDTMLNKFVYTFYNQAAQRGHAGAKCMLANFKFNKMRWSTNFSQPVYDICNKAYGERAPVGAFYRGMYYRYHHLEFSYYHAANYFREAIKEGFHIAKHELAEMMTYGKTIESYEGEGIGMLREMAEKFYLPSRHTLNIIALVSYGCDEHKDFIYNLEILAQSGEYNSQKTLAVSYYKEECTKKNVLKAFNLFAKCFDELLDCKFMHLQIMMSDIESARAIDFLPHHEASMWKLAKDGHMESIIIMLKPFLANQESPSHLSAMELDAMYRQIALLDTKHCRFILIDNADCEYVSQALCQLTGCFTSYSRALSSLELEGLQPFEQQ